MDLDLRVNAMSHWAATTVFVYDVMITLDEEAALIWGTVWSLPKVLYVLSRYFGLASMSLSSIVSALSLSPSFCNVFRPAQTVAAGILASTADCLLLMRVMALFHERRRFCRVLLGIFIAVYLVEGVFFAASFKSWLNASSVGEDSGCLAVTGSEEGGPELGAVVTIPMLVYNTFLFILTLVDVRTRARRDGSTVLLNLFIRDGSLYFGMLCSALAVFTVMAFVYADRPGIVYVGLPWLMVVAPIASCRLILNLRRLARKARLSTIHTSDLSRPEFNVPSSTSEFTFTSSNTDDRRPEYALATINHTSQESVP